MPRVRIEEEGWVISRNTCYGESAFRTVEEVWDRYECGSFSEAVRMLIEAGEKKLLKGKAKGKK